jgi:phosphatidylglycerophosphatase A
MGPPRATSSTEQNRSRPLGQPTPPAAGEESSSRFRTWFCVAISSAFGLGLSPFAPGTFGAVLGVIIHVAILTWTPSGSVFALLLLALVTVSAAHWLVTPFAMDYWDHPDPSHFVLDEVAGYLVVALFCPFMTSWYAIATGFLLFRVLDIIKPPPARQIDRDWTGAAGILFDDLVSGAYAGGALWLLRITANAAGFQQ